MYFQKTFLYNKYSLKIFISFWMSVMMLLFISCKKEKKEEPAPIAPVQGIDLSISYKVDNDIFMTDSFMYKTQAGYQYSITKLVYYLSQISLIKTDSSTVLLKDYQYVDAVLSETNQMILKNIPPGNYIGMKFNIGIDSLHNKSDTLPANVENINMQWPQFMGGGYHFIKMEGYFKDTTGTYGYAMHLGTDSCLVPIKLYKNFTVAGTGKTSLKIIMNINEWFCNPYRYDFNTDGNYIMGKPVMKKIAANGVDVFSF